MKNSPTDLFIKNITKPGRNTASETKGLNLQVKQSLQRYWALRYLFNGKRYDLSIGSYPEISLKEARKRAITARNQLNQGINPKPPKERLASQARQEPGIPTFSEYAVACYELKRLEWVNQKHSNQWINTLREYAFPIIGDLTIQEIDASYCKR